MTQPYSKPNRFPSVPHKTGELEQRYARQAAELEHGRAQAAHEAEQRLRAQLEKDLAATQRRLEAAEKARDTAIKTLEQAASRGTASRKPQR